MSYLNNIKLENSIESGHLSYLNNESSSSLATTTTKVRKKWDRKKDFSGFDITQLIQKKNSKEKKKVLFTFHFQNFSSL